MASEADIEKVARALAKLENRDPNYPVYYEPPGHRRDPIPDEYVGSARQDGSVVEQYPTMPFWKWRYETAARVAVEALDK